MVMLVMMLRSVALLVAAVDCVVAAGALMLVTLRCMVHVARASRWCRAGLAGISWLPSTSDQAIPNRG